MGVHPPLSVGYGSFRAGIAIHNNKTIIYNKALISKYFNNDLIDFEIITHLPNY